MTRSLLARARTRSTAFFAGAAAAALVSAPAAAATSPLAGKDTGAWALAEERRVPTEYFQGLAHDEFNRVLFVGVFKGGYLTDDALRERVRSASLIPSEVEASVGFNHIGDPTWDRAEEGRWLLPLECYAPGRPNGGNYCGIGGIGVAEAGSLRWRYWVRLDQLDIAKAMWAEVSPDGTLLWTSDGRDLLAYRTEDITAANAAAGADSPAIRPVRRLFGAVPPSGVTGATFVQGRLFLAGHIEGRLQVWSVDVQGGSPPRMEVVLPGLRAEPEGLDAFDWRGGTLHWLLSPVVVGGRPSYGGGHSQLLSFVPRARSRLRMTARTARGVIRVRVEHVYDGSIHPVQRASVRAGRVTATTRADGSARLRARPGRVRVRASKLGLRPVTRTVTVRR